MGYTHYWGSRKSLTDKQWTKITKDVRKLFNASPCKLAYEDDSKAGPLISHELIRFNGVGNAGYETFMLHRGPNDEFCKTDRKAYDIVVCGILIVVAKYAPSIMEITSDGGMASFRADYPGPHDSEWDDALTFVTKTLGAGYALPHLIEFRS